MLTSMLIRRPVIAGAAALVPLLSMLTTALAAETSEGGPLLKAAEVFERTLDFMVTLDLGLFALVGFFAKDGLPASSRSGRLIQGSLAAAFFVAAAASLYLGYESRLELMQQLAGGTFAYQFLRYYPRQALALLIAGVFAVCFVVTAISTRRRDDS
jgi:hypothetical protein